jgi:hypothetical protein
MKVKFVTENPPSELCVIGRGMRFNIRGRDYILACLGANYALISLMDGNRYADPSSLSEICDLLNKSEAVKLVY